GPFRARYEFYCGIDVHRPTAPMSALTKALYAGPRPGEHLDPQSQAGTDNERVSALARKLTAGLDHPADMPEALFRYVAGEVANEPAVGGPVVSAAECLRAGSGDPGAKSRLLVALLRNRGIPARMVTGLALARGQERGAHHWVEAWVHDQWMPMCPSNHHL